MRKKWFITSCSVSITPEHPSFIKHMSCASAVYTGNAEATFISSCKCLLKTHISHYAFGLYGHGSDWSVFVNLPPFLLYPPCLEGLVLDQHNWAGWLLSLLSISPLEPPPLQAIYLWQLASFPLPSTLPWETCSSLREWLGVILVSSSPHLVWNLPLTCFSSGGPLICACLPASLPACFLLWQLPRPNWSTVLGCNSVEGLFAQAFSIMTGDGRSHARGHRRMPSLSPVPSGCGQ